MAAEGVDVCLLSVGPDLPWLTGYEAMPLERLTMLVVPRDGDATLVVPNLEVPRVVERPEVFGVRGWGETDDPLAIVADLAGVGVGIVTIGQYLRPTSHHLPVHRWVTPEQFDRYRRLGEELGLAHVESSPLTRSSYHARQAADTASAGV